MEGLRERDLGVLEGLTTDEMKKDYPKEFESFLTLGPDYQLLGRRKLSTILRSMLKCIESNCRPTFRKVDRSGHARRILGAIFRFVLDIPLEAQRNFVLLNCSINRLNRTDKGWNW